MLRLLFRVRDELSDAVRPVVRSGSRSGIRKARVNSQSLLLPKSFVSVDVVSKKEKIDAHFDEAFRLTLSLTCSTVFGFASLLPPPKLIERPTVPRRVPRARYSVLIARPRITLHSNKPMNN